MDGYAPRYSPGVMERVVRRRDLAPAACNISSAYYPLGTWVYVWSHNRHILRYFTSYEAGSEEDFRKLLQGRLDRLGQGKLLDDDTDIVIDGLK